MTRRARSSVRSTLAILAGASMLVVVLATGAGAAPAPMPPVDRSAPVSSDGRTVLAPAGGVGSGSGSSAAARGSAPEPVVSGPSAGYRTPVDARTYPARATVSVEYAGRRVCTGFLIGPSTVATAGSCVVPELRTWRDPGLFRLVPAKSGTSEPFGSCGATRISTVVGWFDYVDIEYNYGAIQLNCTIGEVVGWYGFFATTENLASVRMQINGYPSDDIAGRQWKAVGKTVWPDSRRVYYPVQVVGQPGSPVWPTARPSCSYCAMAIHTYTGPPNYSLSSGTRINRSVFNNLYFWKYGRFPST